MTDRRNVLPVSCPPRGLSRPEAAAYIGVSPGKFDELVADRRMPPPRPIGTRRVWDRLELDAAFTDLPHVEEDNPWDQVA